MGVEIRATGFPAALALPAIVRRKKRVMVGRVEALIFALAPPAYHCVALPWKGYCNSPSIACTVARRCGSSVSTIRRILVISIPK
jgi:acetoin utilization deacetylase AcuC-like enzyme